MQQPMYHSAIHLKRRKIKNGMLNVPNPLWLLRPTCRVVTRSTTWRCLLPQTFRPTMRRIPLSPYTVPRYLIQAQRPQRRDVFGQLPHQCLRRLPVVHNDSATVFVSALVATAHSDFQMLARLETRIAIPLRMCGLFLKMLSRSGVVSFASKAFIF
jgi:hypothetical protein